MRTKAGIAVLLVLMTTWAFAGPAAAKTASNCLDGLPSSGYTATAETASLTLPLGPCRSGRHEATLALTISVTRCVPVTGCGFATTGRAHCRGTRGTCTVSVRVPHDPVEYASYYILATSVAVSGDDVLIADASSSGTHGCVSAVATATCA